MNETHKRAASVGGLADLEDIRLASVNAELGDAAADGPFEIEVGIAPSVSQAEGRAIYDCNYRVKVRGAEGAVAATLDCRYLAVYILGSEEERELSDLVAFGEVTVLRAIHPYLRELVSSLTSRFGLPGITLGVFRVPMPTKSVRKRATKATEPRVAQRATKRPKP
jgi:hypothetical protein